jgi:hypothetical protein
MYCLHHQGKKNQKEPHGITSQKTAFFTVACHENLKSYLPTFYPLSAIAVA